MSISSSLATKAGAASVVTAGGGLVGTYYAWDHITLYEVEREVINKDFRLTVSGPTDKKIKIEAPKSSSAESLKLEGNYSWVCEITVDTTAESDTTHTNLGGYIKNHLQIPSQALSEQQRKNKELLVKACAKDRKPDKTYKSVTGLLTITKTGNEFAFKEHPYLDFLLKWNGALYEVEKKVIDEKVALEVTVINGGQKTIKTKTKSAEGWDEANGYYWECTITAPTGLSNIDKTKWEGKLPITNSEANEKKLKNKQTLVKKCAKSRGNDDTAKKVKATLNLSSLQGVSDETAFLKKLFDEQ